MQIVLNDVSYKKLNNLNFTILNNKITGIVSDDIYDLNNLNFIIKNNLKQNGSIKYSLRKFKNKIGIISISELDEVNNNYDITNLNKDFFSMLNMDEKLLSKDVSILSTSEKIKILFANVLSDNPDTILIDGIFEILDMDMRKKILNLIINLKKFYNKTIVISTIDTDIIYEIVDNLVFIINGNSYYSKNKFSIFENDEIKNNLLVNIPFVKKVENMLKEKKYINLGDNENVNELIKSIYREIR